MRLRKNSILPNYITRGHYKPDIIVWLIQILISALLSSWLYFVVITVQMAIISLVRIYVFSDRRSRR
jgi:hypothetical protein